MQDLIFTKIIKIKALLVGKEVLKAKKPEPEKGIAEGGNQLELHCNPVDGQTLFRSYCYLPEGNTMYRPPG